MTETYLQKLQSERRARLARIAGAAKITPLPAKPLDIKPEEPEKVIPEDITNRKGILFKDIFKEICRYYNVSMLDVLSARRNSKIVRARHMVAYIASQHTMLSHNQISSRLARDRATITHALERITSLLENPVVAEDLRAIKEKLKL